MSVEEGCGGGIEVDKAHESNGIVGKWNISVGTFTTGRIGTALNELVEGHDKLCGWAAFPESGEQSMQNVSSPPRYLVLNTYLLLGQISQYPSDSLVLLAQTVVFVSSEGEREGQVDLQILPAVVGMHRIGHRCLSIIAFW
jgi:hypothetical protein